VAASIAGVVADAKDGLWQRLRTTAGLRLDDGVTVRSAAITPEEFEADMVILGDVTIGPATRPGLAGRQARPTMNGWVIITRPGGDEEATATTRRRAAEIMALVEATVVADPTIDGTIAGPGGTTVSVSGSEESPVDWNGTAARRVTVPFSLSWTSHVS
jgi:hypothetical protein